MKALKTAAGLAAFFFLVFQPLRANLTAAIAILPGVEGSGRTTLLERASQIDKCNYSILEKLGDAWFFSKNYIMAAQAYGRGLTCSPGAAVFRFKYGESILGMGFIDGRDPIKDALRLEPHDPIIQGEVDRIRVFQ